LLSNFFGSFYKTREGGEARKILKWSLEFLHFPHDLYQAAENDSNSAENRIVFCVWRDTIKSLINDFLSLQSSEAVWILLIRDSDFGGVICGKKLKARS
jgi:hypothetical protein